MQICWWEKVVPIELFKEASGKLSSHLVLNYNLSIEIIWLLSTYAIGEYDFSIELWLR